MTPKAFHLHPSQMSIWRCKFCLPPIKDDSLPSKAQWPDDFAAGLGTMRVKTKDCFHDMRLKTLSALDFTAAARQVHRCAGYRCVVVVVKMGEDEPGAAVRTHSAVGVRWNYDGSIVTQNSWGPDSDPLLSVTEKNFAKVFFVEPIIVATRVYRDKRIVLTDTPAISKEWSHMSDLS